ncbi:bifunctional tetrahydrofolate synthase/dihydrofolate synthase [Aquabacterium fontiphilum]|uniref:bifunctional tetrahydrofolate synthase/dihydrofolate synthase n=1 Tax=Aquabacterium fontiphilum TaxID=450365 RepID=UPI0013765E08|nr:bifunctional tetrahydrofolate synthase/dihydrofolate synthase [Aquabacterium fontiphilum]NBD21795.1 bifunctional tetrahydrofolate synthase/dihydrofolate synthase [Aquabacterium fontiphilum]
MTPDVPQTLDQWLAHCERLHPVAIDMGLERVGAVWQRADVTLGTPLGHEPAEGAPVVFTVAGTNGKGSTCAMLEGILLAGGFRVGVYGSPHLVHFEERCRIMGQPVKADDLVPHFAAIEAARGETALTYFEFTTLAILRLLASSGLDAVILEVGLGGRLDAVNVVDTDCAIITSIDLDHMEYLGPDRESIGREKAGIMRAGRPAVVSDPAIPASVVAHAEAIGADLWVFGRDFNYAGDRQQWSWGGRAKRFNSMAYPSLRGANQLLNAAGVLAALEALRHRLPVSAQAVRTGLATVELPGRFQIVPGQPTLILDVAHNPHAAATLAANLDQMGFFPRTHAVWGAMADKDLPGMLHKLLPLVDAWYCTDLPTARAASAAQLGEAIRAARLASASATLPAEQLTTHPDPLSALHAALAAADPADRIVVFGSFYTVGGVLHEGLPRLNAPHMPAAGSDAAGG